VIRADPDVDGYNEKVPIGYDHPGSKRSLSVITD
jgi:hypothetical protein